MSKRALLFVRTATGGTTAFQESQCRDFCSQRGFGVARVVSQLGVGDASEFARTELTGDRDFDVIVVTDGSRFDRRQSRTTALIQQASEVGVQIFTVGGTELTSPENAFMSSMMLAAASYADDREREELRVLAERGMRRVVADLTEEDLASLKSYVGKISPQASSAIAKILEGIQDPENQVEEDDADFPYPDDDDDEVLRDPGDYDGGYDEGSYYQHAMGKDD
jgi:DNA invertase Pin-like site-specific DNA recombinase